MDLLTQYKSMVGPERPSLTDLLKMVNVAFPNQALLLLLKTIVYLEQLNLNEFLKTVIATSPYQAPQHLMLM